MRFQVPQFIDVEDKIFGPLTFKQFIYIAGGVGISVVLFTLLPKFIAFFASIPFVVFSLALAFYKINSKPFVEVVEAYFKYQLASKLYIWKKEEKAPEAKESEVRTPAQVYVPKLSESKLKDLSFALDVQQSESRIEEDRL